MEIFWFVVLNIMLVTYVILDGYDFGAGIVHLFFARTDEEKQSIRNSIGPFWDANEVWLIASGGVLFFAFPTLYASSFSGFYLPLILVLWLLIFRAVGLELRGQVHNHLWENLWDKAFGIASLLLAVFFGAALGNVVRGVNLGMVENGISTQEPHYFFLALWNPTFDPLAEHQGIIDWFTILLGVVAVVTLTIHGANWIILKTSSPINTRLKGIIFKLNVVLAILVVLSAILWHYVKPVPLTNLRTYYWTWIFPVAGFVGLMGQFFIRKFKKDVTGFLFSSLFIFGSFTTTVASLFPNMLPSTNEVNPSLTVYNVAAHEYGLTVGAGWFIIAAILVIAYFVIQLRVFKGKMDDIGYGEH
ncbi:cytochrome d ubiquinol oxidase subunit II [Flavihumibacter solisilvae]|uniref:Cytochrome D ubiquinol oxidase subunit II n=1 Tax=Flavihumibacter solisilvae TaxID=1349421 RepID=A0A0C1IV76_9BACT|nr:cytochrome d ubiquinol oxidase subunit II [Flavihumibacter solisilvae]KIC94414.1 cytochrome D ubiquinol oxidase subunit II [Flavihumibacter solisilvae]